MNSKMKTWRISALVGILVIGGVVMIVLYNRKKSSEKKQSVTEHQITQHQDFIVEQETIDWLKKASKPYREQGVEINGAFERLVSTEFIHDVLAPRFEEITGIKVNVKLDREYFSNWDTYFTDKYDIGHLEQDLITQYKHLADLNQMFEDYPEFKIPAFNFDHFTPTALKGVTWKRDGRELLLGIPTESLPKIYVYRKDLFENPKIQDAFYRRYGYLLAPARTRREYLEISKFFTEYSREEGLDLYGNIITTSSRNNGGAYEWTLDIQPAFGVYHWGLNPKTFRAKVSNGGMLNSKQSKEAFQHWMELRKNSPPEAFDTDWNDKQRIMAEGRVAQCMMYQNFSRAVTDSLNKYKKGKISFALNPITPEAYELVSKGKGYIGYDDLTGICVNSNSKHLEMAFLFVQFVGLPFHQRYQTIKTLSTTHLAVFSDPVIAKLEEEYGNVFIVPRNYAHFFKPNMTYPFHGEVLSVMQEYIRNIIEEKIGISDGLDAMAEAVERKIESMGYYDEK